MRGTPTNPKQPTFAILPIYRRLTFLQLAWYFRVPNDEIISMPIAKIIVAQQLSNCCPQSMRLIIEQQMPNDWATFERSIFRVMRGRILCAVGMMDDPTNTCMVERETTATNSGMRDIVNGSLLTIGPNGNPMQHATMQLNNRTAWYSFA